MKSAIGLTDYIMNSMCVLRLLQCTFSPGSFQGQNDVIKVTLKPNFRMYEMGLKRRSEFEPIILLEK